MVDEFNNVFNYIKKNRTNRLEGNVNAIPFSGKNALSKYLPGVQKGKYYLLSGNQKSGKSSLTDDMFVYNVIKFLRDNPDTNISVKIKYFSLELSKQQKILGAISRLLYEKNDTIISAEDLLSLYDDRILNEDIINEIESIKDDIKFLLDRVEYIETEKNSWGIFKNVEDYLRKVGIFTYKVIDFGEGKGPVEVKDKYIENDPNHYVIVIVDHISLLSPQKDQIGIKGAIDKWSSDHCIHLRNKYNCTIVNVQQMSAQSQSKEYYKGEAIIDKLRPAPSHLGESKVTSRDANVLISIFNPFAYDIDELDEYDITKTNDGLRDNFRQIVILLNRNGVSNISFNMFFAGAISFFKELPPPTSNAMNSVKSLMARINNH